MRASFEKMVTDELDTLYQGALFLSAGDERTADELLLDAVTRAQDSLATAPHGAASRTWLYRILAEEFLERPPRYRIEEAGADDPTKPRASPRPAGEGGMDPAALAVYRAAGSTPHAARPALWLVLVCRWKYRDAAQLLGIDLQELQVLLRFRTTFIAAAVRDYGRLSGSAAIG